MKPGNRVWLFAIDPGPFPAVVEEHGDDVMPSTFGDCQEREDIFEILGGVSDVGGHVEKDS